MARNCNHLTLARILTISNLISPVFLRASDRYPTEQLPPIGWCVRVLLGSLKPSIFWCGLGKV